MGYSLKILSPVHIGCGEKYTGLNYIIDNNGVYVFEPETIMHMLGPAECFKFAEWLEQSSNELEKLDSEFKFNKNKNPRSEITKRIKKEFDKRKREFALSRFVELNSSLRKDQLMRSAIYSTPIQGESNKSVEINAFVKQMHKPYIPGSELKGAIRTAIMHCTFSEDAQLQLWLRQSITDMLAETVDRKKGNATYRNYIDDVKNQTPSDSRKKWKKSILVQRIGKLESILQNMVFNGNLTKPDAKYDVMKFIQVGDSASLDTRKNLIVSYVVPFNISRVFKVFYEFLRPDTHVALSSFCVEHEKYGVKRFEKISFLEAQKQMVENVKTVLSYCYRFTKDLISEEILYFQKHHNKSGIVAHLREIEKENTPEAPVIRIGKDEGYTSLTVGLAVKKLMPDLYENVLIHATKNKSYDSSITRDDFYFPKSRKIVNWNGQEMTAGWVQLLTDDDSLKTENDKKLSQANQSSAVVDLSQLKSSPFYRGK